ncbi:MAG: ribosome hibernation-promoting factor, HPF/YfiA family [Solirubrobacteraceae bacterium]
MRLTLKGRHVELVPSIRDHAERKLARLSDQLGADVPVEVELSEEPHARHIAEATVYTKGTTLRARASGSDLRAAIDRLARMLERQLQRYRDKRRLEPRRRTRG